jgi:hypothetical protein
LRQNILWARKALKGSSISIADDMTRENLKLMRQAEESRLFEAVWFVNGKVKAKDRKGKKESNLNILEKKIILKF